MAPGQVAVPELTVTCLETHNGPSSAQGEAPEGRRTSTGGDVDPASPPGSPPASGSGGDTWAQPRSPSQCGLVDAVTVQMTVEELETMTFAQAPSGRGVVVKKLPPMPPKSPESRPARSPPHFVSSANFISPFATVPADMDSVLTVEPPAADPQPGGAPAPAETPAEAPAAAPAPAPAETPAADGELVLESPQQDDIPAPGAAERTAPASAEEPGAAAGPDATPQAAAQEPTEGAPEQASQPPAAADAEGGSTVESAWTEDLPPVKKNKAAEGKGNPLVPRQSTSPRHSFSGRSSATKNAEVPLANITDLENLRLVRVEAHLKRVDRWQIQSLSELEWTIAKLHNAAKGPVQVEFTNPAPSIRDLIGDRDQRSQRLSIDWRSRVDVLQGNWCTKKGTLLYRIEGNTVQLLQCAAPERPALDKETLVVRPEDILCGDLILDMDKSTKKLLHWRVKPKDKDGKECTSPTAGGRDSQVQIWRRPQSGDEAYALFKKERKAEDERLAKERGETVPDRKPDPPPKLGCWRRFMNTICPPPPPKPEEKQVQKRKQHRKH
eukprot:TRINITY_DN7986_c0_g3_i1.p1 TRINITY_DN7986_c0_g3~~TRINITY_DN7986_c0_g3_i1.p1  ORF type:complete len:592 (+),score=153.72 TRINITY_DN7986_c0_g3_i1:119-1777(+)